MKCGAHNIIYFSNKCHKKNARNKVSGKMYPLIKSYKKYNCTFLSIIFIIKISDLHYTHYKRKYL